jgi:hypothetical protein
MDERPGTKHAILFIPHSINRIWRNLMLLDLVIWVSWWFAPYGAPIFAPPNDKYLMILGVFVIVLILFFVMIRNWGYVQALPTHVKVAVPFFHLKIPYKYVDNVRMTEFRQLFNYRELNWADKRFLQPYFRETVATLHLKKFPKPFYILRIFIPKYLFLPHEAGFLFLIKDFLRLNTEVDSRLAAYRDRRRAKVAATNAFNTDR